eukprot:4335449-Prymnesium_polylepis.1
MPRRAVMNVAAPPSRPGYGFRSSPGTCCSEVLSRVSSDHKSAASQDVGRAVRPDRPAPRSLRSPFPKG